MIAMASPTWRHLIFGVIWEHPSIGSMDVPLKNNWKNSMEKHVSDTESLEKQFS